MLTAIHCVSASEWNAVNINFWKSLPYVETVTDNSGCVIEQYHVVDRTVMEDSVYQRVQKHMIQGSLLLECLTVGDNDDVHSAMLSGRTVVDNISVEIFQSDNLIIDRLIKSLLMYYISYTPVCDCIRNIRKNQMFLNYNYPIHNKAESFIVALSLAEKYSDIKTPLDYWCFRRLKNSSKRIGLQKEIFINNYHLPQATLSYKKVREILLKHGKYLILLNKKVIFNIGDIVKPIEKSNVLLLFEHGGYWYPAANSIIVKFVSYVNK